MPLPTSLTFTLVTAPLLPLPLHLPIPQETQNIRQYHYTAWPDHLKPTSIYPILRMIQMLQDARKQPKVPIVVHCSAGCGRTGTIITIDIIRTALNTKVGRAGQEEV